MLFKMLGIERSWELHNDNEMKMSLEKPRQVFVTKSRVLAVKVSEYFSKLLGSLATAGRSPKELVKLAGEKDSQRDGEGLVDLDDERDWRQDLPSRFSLLRDGHFPLFITFDRVSISLVLSRVPFRSS